MVVTGQFRDRLVYSEQFSSSKAEELFYNDELIWEILICLCKKLVPLTLLLLPPPLTPSIVITVVHVGVSDTAGAAHMFKLYKKFSATFRWTCNCAISKKEYIMRLHLCDFEQKTLQLCKSGRHQIIQLGLRGAFALVSWHALTVRMVYAMTHHICHEVWCVFKELVLKVLRKRFSNAGCSEWVWNTIMNSWRIHCVLSWYEVRYTLQEPLL
jgi:hypothetical protein